MREIKLKQYSQKQKAWQSLNLTKLQIVDEKTPVCEYINFIDQYGQDIYTYDFVVIENNITSKTFVVKFNPEQLAYGFVTLDKQEQFYTLEEIRGLYNKEFTITKIA